MPNLFRKIKNEFSQKIYREDLKYVLINGLILGFLISVLLGFVAGYLYMSYGFSTFILLFLLGYLVGSRVRKSYYNYHPLYPIISVLIVLFGYYFYQVAFSLSFLLFAKVPLKMMLIFFNKEVFLAIYSMLSPISSGQFSLIGLINLLCFILTLVFAYRNATRYH